MTTANLFICYNKGCGKQFDPSNNNEDSCQFHPGVPVFHDALKGWSCCNKKSTDFSTFLSIQGCTKASHSNIKPIEPEKPKEEEIKIKETVTVFEPVKPQEPMIRPSGDEELVNLKKIIAPTLISALENLKLNTTNEKENTDTVPIGTSCKNHGCQATYQGEISNTEKCTNHPGTAVFHEGMKYWSCCQRKTSDFDNFLNQEGCSKSSHLWFKKESNDKATNCRSDFHQTGGFAILTVFSKNPVPNECIIKANSVKLDINISFEGGSKSFNQTYNLFGIIDVENSQVNYFGSKIEIKLKKAEPISWKKFEL